MSVTLAKALQAKSSALEEEEIWALLLLGTECLLKDLHKGEQMSFPPGAVFQGILQTWL